MSEDDFHKNIMVPDKTADDETNHSDVSSPAEEDATNDEGHGSGSAAPEDSLQTATELGVSDHTAVTAPTDTDVTDSLDQSERFHSTAVEGEAATGSSNPNEVASTFPQRLMEILDDPRNAELIAWLPHGRAFVIYRKREFASDVLPKYFQKFAKYSSFTRKLNRWGFVRVTRGPETGAYYHPLFRQNEGRLVLQMTCHSSVSQSNNNNNASSKRGNADGASGTSAADSNEPPPSSMMMYPNSVNSSYNYASYNYPHPNAFTPMDHSSQQHGYGPYGYDPPGGGGPYSHSSSSGMYPPLNHQYPLMGAPSPYPMFAASHNMMEGYGSYDEKQPPYSSNSMLMPQRNVDPQSSQPYSGMNHPSYHSGDDAHLMPPMDERGYYHESSGKMKGVPSSFRPARKGHPPFYPPYSGGGAESGPYGSLEEDEAERMRSAALPPVDDREMSRRNRTEENALYSPAVRRPPPAAYYGAPEGREY